MNRPGQGQSVTMKQLRTINLLIAICFACGAVSAQTSAVNVRLVNDEAEAVLAILAKRKANQPIVEADWQRVFQSEGYARLKQRETSMQRSFEDADFKTSFSQINSRNARRLSRKHLTSGNALTSRALRDSHWRTYRKTRVSKPRSTLSSSREITLSSSILKTIRRSSFTSIQK